MRSLICVFITHTGIKQFVDSMLIVTPIVVFCGCSVFCCALLVLRRRVFHANQTSMCLDPHLN